MSIFSRIADLWSANVHALLDRVEDPDMMSTQVLREMEDRLLKARRYAALAVIAERRLSRELEQQRTAAQRWQTRARGALTAGREDQARRALACKMEHDHFVRGLEAQAEAARRTTANMKAALWGLEARLAEARQKQQALLARHRAAKARQELHRGVGADVLLVGRAEMKWERLEHQLTELEDHLAAQDELQSPRSALESELHKMEASQDLESELQALKREVEGGKG